MLSNMIDTTRIAGTFHAVSTRDGEGMRRSGEHFYQYRELPERAPSESGALYEVLFADGVWMLARVVDLEFRR